MSKIAEGKYEEMACALIIARSLTRRMHSWSCLGLAISIPCYVCGALLPLEESTTSHGKGNGMFVSGGIH
jgi:TPP-dependent indolepyruvate ferredoxin oxidoreductase alpha subunit